MQDTDSVIASPRAVPVGDNATPIWGMTVAERFGRIVAAQRFAADGDMAGSAIVANMNFVFDPAWMTHLARRPGTILTRGGVPVLAYVTDDIHRETVSAVMIADAPIEGAPDLTVIAAEAEGGIFNEQLRKRETPFAERLTPASIAAIERASYVGAYKGVTDLLTKYLWPEWALAITRMCARAGITPNQVTAAGTVLCVIATIAFWYGWFWTGLATGLTFMVLDTVDGKLARCTITSSALGNAWDHGIDLVHPPFWWWAWAAGCAPYGRALSDETFWAVMAAMLVGYVAQRLIEGAFIVRFGMHIHVWERFDSRFRLITARRNPNMVILFISLIVARPDWGIVAVALWTVLSLIVHLVRLWQAEIAQRRAPISSWLA